MSDIVARIRGRFPRPRHADDGLLANEAADEIERLRGDLERAIRYKDNNIKIADDALDRAERAEAVVEVADEFYTRLLVAHAAGEFEMPPRLAPFAEALGEAFDAYDKE